MSKEKTINLRFLGAAGTVTGSKYLIEVDDHKILVDCGLFQGLKKLRDLNWQNFPIDPAEIDTVLLTHGHLDHTGYLPRLVRQGFMGTVLATQPTLDVAEVILRDSALINEEEAKKANEEGFSKHEPAEPLYDLTDAVKAINRFTPLPENQWEELVPGISLRFQYNGHIIGATFIELDIFGKRMVFSGDVGKEEDYLMYPPKKPERADVLFIESTYGNRLHPEEDVEEKLRQLVEKANDNGGTLIIPSFAVERAQTLMYLLHKLRDRGEIPELPMFLDSPMGLSVLSIFHAHKNWHKLREEEYKAMVRDFTVVQDSKETFNIMDMQKPKIVIAASGMITGGKVLTYLTRYLERPETIILISGFQAEGTRGRALLEGQHELKIYGHYYPVNAEIHQLHTLSSHADQKGLLDWVSTIKEPPEKTFIVHGEQQAAEAFRIKLKDTLGWDSQVPELNSTVKITIS